jgi:hypothetical protein
MPSLKEALRKRFPHLYTRVRDVTRRGRVEYKVLRQIGVRTLLSGRLWRTAPWNELLPLQTPRRIRLDGVAIDTVERLVGRVEAKGIEYASGGHTVYLPPRTIAASDFRALQRYYPSDAGLKIIRKAGEVATSRYLSGTGHSLINRRLTRDHGRLTLVANLLHLSSLGPRLYDLVELECAGTVWTAYVVQHVDGRPPTGPECEQGLQGLHRLEDQGIFRVTLPNGWAHKDFQCPSCNGNALVDASGNFQYLDFQNFVLVDYESFLEELALEAVADTHFGTESVIRGGRFLYQSVPGVRLPARRSIDDRVLELHRLMAQAGLSVRDRIVLDVGCNIGMMMGEYLKAGASWCHGWDRAGVTPHAERLLLALGCTRVSTTGGDIERHRRLEDDLPPFLRDSLSGCVVSYLAVRRHLGWLDALSRLPWSFLLYEGHQQEGRAGLDRDLSEFLRMTEFEVAGIGSYKDGLSDERYVSLLRRREAS